MKPATVPILESASKWEDLGLHHHGHPHIRSEDGKRPDKSFGRNANDAEWLPVEGDRISDDLWITAVGPLPVSVTENGNRVSPGCYVILRAQ